MQNKITFIYDHKPNETWSTPLSLLNEFKERGWETEIVSIPKPVNSTTNSPAFLRIVVWF